MQMWNDLKNENNKHSYTAQNVESHWFKEVQPGHIFGCYENEAIKENNLFGMVEWKKDWI